MYKSSLFLVALISVVFLLSAGVNAQPQIKTWYTIPTYLSVDTPFIWVVETQALQDGTRLSWQKYVSPTAAGSFNKVSPSGWACFFATDSSATCGPTPLLQGNGQKTGTFQGIIQLSGIGLNESSNFEINVSGLQVEAKKSINGSSVDAWVTVAGSTGSSTVTYRLFNAATLALAKSGNATFRSSQGDYFVNLNLNAGKYYLVFDVVTQNTPQLKGGNVLSFELGGVGSQPLQSAALEVSISEIDATVIPGDTVDRQFVIKNPTTAAYSNLSVVLSDKTRQYVTIDLASKNLAAGNSTDYTLKVRADRNIIIKDSFDVVNTENGVPTILKTVPLDIKLTLTGSAAQPVTTGDKPVMDVDPLVISGLKILTGNGTSQDLVVRNIGSGNLTLQQPEIEGFTGDVIGVNWDKPVVTSSVPGKITISLRPVNTGDYKGRVKIKSDGGVKTVYLDFSAFDDISSSIDNLKKDVGSYKGNLTKQGVSSADADKFLSSVITYLDNAKSSQSGGNYAIASKQFEQASSEFKLVKSLLSSSTNITKPVQEGFPIWIIAIIIVIVIIIVLFVLKKRKKKPQEGEEGYEEPEGYEEEGYDK